jgi:hypothetical protein
MNPSKPFLHTRVALVLAAGIVASSCHRRQPPPASSAPPAPPTAAVRVLEVCVGAEHSCERRSNGQVLCWGDNARFQIAPSRVQLHAPEPVAGFSDATALRCGSHRTCVRTRAGQIECRGRPDGGIARVALPGRAQDFIRNHLHG